MDDRFYSLFMLVTDCLWGDDSWHWQTDYSNEENQ